MVERRPDPANRAATPGAPRSIVLFNVKYSPNLGDGIIALCLEEELSERLGNARVGSIDLAGRTEYKAPERTWLRRLKLMLLQRLPTPLKDRLVEVALGRVLRRLRPAWNSVLAGADAAVFGGGQLIQDGDLNFPLKLAAASEQCRLNRIPIAVFAVGVGKSRSKRGRHYFSRLFASPDLVHLAVRDAQSAVNLAGYSKRPADLCRDPGLLAARRWPAPASPARRRPLVGVGITHPIVLNHHSNHGGRTSSAASLALYCRIVGLLVSGGFDVVCFTNGAGEDEAFMATASARLLAAHREKSRISIAPRCATPYALAGLIASCDGIVSHRLHAGIVAYSYRVPSIGLRWDNKLDAFFGSVGRPGYIIDFDETAIAEICALMARACGEGVDEPTHERVLDEASDAIAILAEALATASRPAPAQAEDQLGHAAITSRAIVGTGQA